MQNILKYLDQLGFSKIESKIYLILLKYGSMTVTQLAERAKINRTAAYAYINALFKKGVLIKIKGNKNEISANSPEHLKYLVENKENMVRNLKTELPLIIKSLNLSYNSSNTEKDSEIKYYKGRAGAKAIYEECLKSKELRSYFNGAEIEKVFPENYKLFHDAFQDNPQIVMQEILENSPETIVQIDSYNQNERYYYKFFPQDVKLLANDILIYDEKVAIINIGDSNNISGVVISNKDYYNNSKLLFDLLWKLLPEPEVISK